MKGFIRKVAIKFKLKLNQEMTLSKHEPISNDKKFKIKFSNFLVMLKVF